MIPADVGCVVKAAETLSRRERKDRVADCQEMRAQARYSELDDNLDCCAGHHRVNDAHAAVVDVPERSTTKQECTAANGALGAESRTVICADTEQVDEEDDYNGSEDGNHGIRDDGDQLQAVSAVLRH